MSFCRAASGPRPAWVGPGSTHSRLQKQAAGLRASSSAAQPTRSRNWCGRPSSLGLQAQPLRRRHWTAASAGSGSDAAAGGGDGAGGGAGGGGGGGDGDGGDDGSPGLGSNVWVLALAAAATLAIFRVGSQQLKERGQQSEERLRQRVARWLASLDGAGGDEAGSPDGSSGSDEVRTLTRLTQEAFAELVKVKERLEELESNAGLAPPHDSSAPAGASRLASTGSSSGSGGSTSSSGSSRAGDGGSSGGQKQQQQRGRHRPGRQRLSGMLRMGGGLVWAPEEAGGTNAASDVLRAAGLRLGTDALLHLSSLVRGGRDSVHAEYRLEPAAERVTLRKILYSCRVAPWLRVVLAPFGARGTDVAYTLNPLEGQGLSSMVRDGSPLHRPVLGSLAGVALQLPRAWFNAGYFARALPAGGTASALLAQLVVAPTNDLSAGLALLEHRREAAGAAAAGAADRNGSGGGDAAGPRPALVGSLGRAGAAVPGAVPAGSAAGEARQLGAMLAWRAGQFAVLHGWAAADADEVRRGVQNGQLAQAARPREWGLALGSYPDGSGSGWTLGVGRSAAVGGVAGSSSTGEGLEPNVYELSLQFNLGDGLLLTPGMVVLPRGGGEEPTAFLGLRSAWAF